MELKPEWGQKTPKTTKETRGQIAEQMADTADWRDAHGKASLVGKSQEDAEAELLGEDLRVNEFMAKENVISFAIPNAEELVRIGLRILPEQSVASLLKTAREYLLAAKFGNENEMLEQLQNLREVEESIPPADLKKYPGLGAEFHAAIDELIKAAKKLAPSTVMSKKYAA